MFRVDIALGVVAIEILKKKKLNNPIMIILKRLFNFVFKNGQYRYLKNCCNLRFDWNVYGS